MASRYVRDLSWLAAVAAGVTAIAVWLWLRNDDPDSRYSQIKQGMSIKKAVSLLGPSNPILSAITHGEVPEPVVGEDIDEHRIWKSEYSMLFLGVKGDVVTFVKIVRHGNLNAF